MILRVKPLARRGGATTVEAAMVMSVFLLFLFGIFEYCRFIFFLNVATNAARDASRYAAVNVSFPTNFDYVNYTYGGTTYVSINGYVSQRIATMGNMLTNYTVVVFPCDNSQLTASSPVVQRKPAASYPTLPLNPTSPYTSYLAWNDAAFGERIAVSISGTYTPVLPNFLLMQSTYSMNIVVTTGSEG